MLRGRLPENNDKSKRCSIVTAGCSSANDSGVQSKPQQTTANSLFQIFKQGTAKCSATDNTHSKPQQSKAKPQIRKYVRVRTHWQSLSSWLEGIVQLSWSHDLLIDNTDIQTNRREGWVMYGFLGGLCAGLCAGVMCGFCWRVMCGVMCAHLVTTFLSTWCPHIMRAKKQLGAPNALKTQGNDHTYRQNNPKTGRFGQQMHQIQGTRAPELAALLGISCPKGQGNEHTYRQNNPKNGKFGQQMP